MREAGYKQEGPLKRSDYGVYRDICKNGMPVDKVLDAYNSIMLQVNRSMIYNAKTGITDVFSSWAEERPGRPGLRERL